MARPTTYTGPCKREGCERPAKSRGMCKSCYECWRKKTPINLSPLDTRKLVLAAMPSTSKAIAKKLELSRARVNVIILALRFEGLAYLDAYHPPEGVRGNWLAVYARGNRPDAILSREAVRDHARAVRRQQHAAKVAKMAEIRAAAAERFAQSRAGMAYADIFNRTGNRPDLENRA